MEIVNRTPEETRREPEQDAEVSPPDPLEPAAASNEEASNGNESAETQADIEFLFPEGDSEPDPEPTEKPARAEPDEDLSIPAFMRRRKRR